MRRKSSGAGREEAELRGGAGGGQRAARTWQLVQEQRQPWLRLADRRGFGNGLALPLLCLARARCARRLAVDDPMSVAWFCTSVTSSFLRMGHKKMN